MNRWMLRKPFGIGFTCGLLICSFLNYYSYLRNVCPEGIDDCGWRFGFPIDFYERGGFVGFEKIIWLGVISDIGFAITLSFLIGFVFTSVGQKIKRPQV